MILPIYFALHIYLSGGRSFYHPSPRAINPRAAKALPMALLVAYTPSVLKFWHSSMSAPKAFVASGWNPYLMHIALPVTLHIGKLFYDKGASKLTVGQLLYSTRDLKYLTRFFGILLVLATIAHWMLLSRLISYSGSTAFETVARPSTELVQLASLAISVLTWCCFMTWDMRRVNLTTRSPLAMFFCSSIGCIIFGPAAVLTALWQWREIKLENGRKRV